MNEEKTVSENKMSSMPVNQLLITMSVPMMLSMLVQALYNIVDSIFVARIGGTGSLEGEAALAAISLVFPVQNLMIAIGSGTMVGVNSLLSRSLGEKNQNEVNYSAGNGLLLTAINAVLFLIIGLFFSSLFIRSQIDEAMIINHAIPYMMICTGASFALFGQITMERLLQSTGKTVHSMIIQLVGAIINIILDPIMIFGLLGFPAMGMAGAALATVMGQFCAFCIGLYFNLRHNDEITFSKKFLRPRKQTIKRIYSVGFPTIIMLSIGSVMVYCMNKILIVFSSTATALFGVYFKLQSFIFMPIFGMNNGLIPIISYNYGARKKDRIVKAIRLSVLYAIGIMMIGFAIFQLVPHRLLTLFDASEDMLAIGVVALRTISTSFLAAGFCIICGTVFQSLSKGMLSLFISIIRQIVVLIPSAYLLSKLGNLDYVWLAFPISEVVSFVLSAVALTHVYRTIIKPIKPYQLQQDTVADAK